MTRRPGTPRLLRELNDRAALELLIARGPLTRAQIGSETGLSKVTASQLLSRLEERGLVEVVGEQAGGRGPNAALYAVVPASAYVAGLEIGPRRVTVAIADITGRVVAQETVPAGPDLVSVVHRAVHRAASSAGIAVSRLTSCVIGTPGVVDPRSGEVQFSFDVPAWHEGVVAGLRADLGRPVVLENDVNLVAVAERAYGAARDVDDFALLWLDRGLGLAVTLGGRPYRGLSGGAGEIGYLPVPGVPLPEGVTDSMSWGGPALAGGFASLLGADAILALARTHDLLHPQTPSPGPTIPPSEAVSPGSASSPLSAAECVRAATTDLGRFEPFLTELATRISFGVSAVTIILDPGLIVLAGELAVAGGQPLADLVSAAVARICPTRPHVTVTQMNGDPVLRGALHAALEQAREEVFSTTTA